MEKKCYFCQGSVILEEDSTEVKAIVGPTEKVKIVKARCSLGLKDCPILDIYKALNEIAINEGLRISRDAL